MGCRNLGGIAQGSAPDRQVDVSTGSPAFPFPFSFPEASLFVMQVAEECWESALLTQEDKSTGPVWFG